MTWSKHLCCVLMVFGVALLTAGCQFVFGDYKVGNSLQTASGGVGNGTGGSPGAAGHAPNGGAAGATQSGPIVVTPTANLFTSDAGAQAKFSVSLASKPSENVTLPVTSDNAAEGVASPASLTFTPDNWAAPQMVTVTGQHDPQKGDQVYAVDVGPADSTDSTFKGAKVAVSITNIDNDSAGMFVTPKAGLITTEVGGQAVFTVVLNSKPSAPVSVAISSSDTSIGTVSPQTLTFTDLNYASPHTVTITGQNDDIASGDRPYQIQVGPLTSADASYANLPSQTVDVTGVDNDVPRVMVALATGIDPADATRLRTYEKGDSATFTVVLTSAPSKDVTIPFTSTRPDEGKVSPASLTFTHANYAAPQTVTVIGVDDSIQDGDQPYQVTLGPLTTDDPGYKGLSVTDLPYVNVVNIDNDVANFTVTLLTGLDPNDPTELRTDETGAKATFSLSLTSKPKDSVSVGLSSTNENEGKVSPQTVQFTVDNWDEPQTVTVTGQPDGIKDGNVVFSIVRSTPTSNDPDYQALPAGTVKVINDDDDVADITTTLLSGIDGGTKLITTEGGGVASFSVALTSKPTANVTIPVVSSLPSEGKPSTTTLTFTPANYAMAQSVMVTGQDDSIVDGNQVYTITVGPSSSTDMNYVGLSQTIKVTNMDNDQAYIVVDPPSVNGTTQEKGTSVTFKLSLASQPTDTVTLKLTSSDTNEGTVSPASLQFTPSTWNIAQSITVTGVDDKIADGDKSYTVLVTATTTDPNYKTQTQTLSLVNKDDDVVGLKATPNTGLQTTEAAGPNKTATFTVVLTSQPTGSVVIAVTSSDTKEGTVSPATLTFTSGATSNWNTPQTVTVTGVNDDIADADKAYTVKLAPTSATADAKYAALAASTVSLTNVNDDVAGVTVTPTSCATTPGTSANFSVVLKSQPLGPVTINLVSSNTMEGTIPTASAALSFSATSWNLAQSVIVTGVDDGTTGTMTSYAIQTSAVSTADPAYNNIDVADVMCVNTTPAPVPPGP